MNNIPEVFNSDEEGQSIRLVRSSNEQRELEEEKRSLDNKFFSKPYRADIFVVVCIISVIVGIALTASFFIHELSAWYLLGGLLFICSSLLVFVVPFKYTSLYPLFKKYSK